MPNRIPAHIPARVRTRRPRRDESCRPSAAARGYCDKAHKAWRLAVLTRDAWQCQGCLRVCSDRREAHADHIVPISQGGERYDVANGQTLCLRCHGRKTRHEQIFSVARTDCGSAAAAANRLAANCGAPEGGSNYPNFAN